MGRQSAVSHTKGSALRAVLFDYRALIRAPEERRLPTSPEALAGRAAVRAAGIGISPASGGLFEMREPQQLLATGKVAQMLQSEIRDELTKRGASGVGMRDELVERLDRLLAAEEREPARVPAGGMPAVSAAAGDAEHASAASNRRWILQPGIVELMEYVDMRGVLRLVLPDAAGDEAAGAAQADEVTRTLKILPWAHVVPAAAGRSLRRGQTPARSPSP